MKYALPVHIKSYAPYKGWFLMKYELLSLSFLEIMHFTILFDLSILHTYEHACRLMNTHIIATCFSEVGFKSLG